MLINGEMPEEMRIVQLGAVVAVVIVAAVAFVALSESLSEEDGRISLVVSISPQAELAEAIGGDHARITVMVPPGQEPHTYEPTPSQMKIVEDADMYMMVGSGIEFELVWMERFVELNLDMIIVNASEGIELISIGDVGSVDPHVWLSPVCAMKMTENLRDALKDFDPNNATDYDDGADQYLVSLSDLDDYISESLEPLENRNMLVLHPAWGYFAKTYNLTQIAIEQEGKEPSAEDIALIIETARDLNITVVFAEPEFNTAVAEQIAEEIGGSVLLVDPLASDYIDNLRSVADQISEGLAQHA